MLASNQYQKQCMLAPAPLLAIRSESAAGPTLDSMGLWLLGVGLGRTSGPDSEAIHVLQGAPLSPALLALNCGLLYAYQALQCPMEALHGTSAQEMGLESRGLKAFRMKSHEIYRRQVDIHVRICSEVATGPWRECKRSRDRRK